MFYSADQNLLQPAVIKEENIDEKPSSFLYSLEDGYGTVYFFEKDLAAGKQTTIPQLMKTMSKSPFLPQDIADSLPFSSSKVSKILKQFSVEPNSRQAKFMKHTIDDCEASNIKGEDKYCTISFESLVKSTMSRLGSQINVVPNEADRRTKAVDFTIGEGVQNMGGKQAVCHKTNYPYAVYLCHSFEKTDTYSVPLFGSDGTKTKAVVICHKDSLAWNSKHSAFKQLNLKPGTVPICHFLTIETVVWVPK